MNIREITDETEKNEVIEQFCMEDETADLDKIFLATKPNPSDDDQYPEIYFFQNKDGMYHTVVERDDIHTSDLEEVKTFIAQFWA